MSELARILVVGSNSFSGASFCATALERGAEVIGMSRSAEPHEAFLPYVWGEHRAGFRFFQLDLNADLDRIMEVIERERPTVVVNFAAQSMVAQSWDNPDHWFMTNVVSSLRFHERLRHCEYLNRYLHVTTPEVYGSTDGFITEDAPFNPSTPYAVSRAAADMSLRVYHEAHGFPVLFTRAANVYGPGQRLYRIIPRTLLYLRMGRQLSLHGGGVSQRSFIHIADVAEATWRILEAGTVGATYHISTREIVSIRDLVERICEMRRASFETNVAIGEERLGKDAAYLLDSNKLRDELGWSNKIPLNQGLEDCVEWMDRYYSDLKCQSLEYEHKP